MAVFACKCNLLLGASAEVRGDVGLPEILEEHGAVEHINLIQHLREELLILNHQRSENDANMLPLQILQLGAFKVNYNDYLVRLLLLN